MSAMSSRLDQLLSEALEEFAHAVSTGHWWGRENEAISLFALGHLVKRCRPDSPLIDPAQIGIEVAVPQHVGGDAKPQVRKDLVLWPRPGMTCWEDAARTKPTRYPMAILEWKINRPAPFEGDIEWLQSATLQSRELVGYAVALCVSGRPFVLRAARVCGGKTERD